jgi:hypothetical protein
MTSLLICIVCFFVTFALARRSLVWGLAVCIGVGYVFGVLKANILDTFSFFIWDASVAGLYACYFSRRPTTQELLTTDSLRLWVGALILWPVLLTIVPVQYPLIQLVGLRANTFLLPFLLVGARLKAEEVDELAVFLAALNVAALGLAVTEYFVGLEWFFPRNPVTEIIYNSRDVAANTAFRIPAFFINAAAYSGTMVMTVPFLLGAWARESVAWRRKLISAGVLAALIGVFLGASRTHALMVLLLMIGAAFGGELKSLSRAGLILILVFAGWLVSNNERLQRFTTLLDTEFVTDRVASSVNLPFLEAALEYPFGVGMGGGGTSIPYFLREQILEPVAAENEYVRIMLEEGVLGLCLWVTFVVWMATRRNTSQVKPQLGRSLARFVTVGYFALACLGTGLLATVPQSALMLIAAGWACSGFEYSTVRREARAKARDYIEPVEAS